MADVGTSSLRKLDLGCGNRKREGATGVDFNDRTQADIVHNLNVFPYPFDEGSFDEIYLDNTLEHLDEPLHVMEEVYRLCRPGGLVKVIVPYFRSPWAYHDPTHTHFFTVHSFAYYDPDHIVCQRYDYTLARFKVEKIRFNETYVNRWTKRLALALAHRWPARYEYYFSQLYALDEVSFYLRRL